MEDTAELTKSFRKDLNMRFEISKHQLSAPLTAPPPPLSPMGLLRLAFEIRLQIYRYCVPHNYDIEVHCPSLYLAERKDRFIDLEGFRDDTLNLGDDNVGSEGILELQDKDVMENLEAGTVHSGGKTSDTEGDYWNCSNNNSIFLLSRQISNEALDILYGENIFKLHLHGDGEDSFNKNFTEANRQRMRYLLVIAEPLSVSYGLGRMPDSELWSSILPTLKVLRIIAEQPVEAGSSHGAPSLEQDIDRWGKRIKPFLQCFGQYLSKEAIVQVDINGQAEAKELVEECLSHCYRMIRCRLFGDLIFKRGRFSSESGCWDTVRYVNSRSLECLGNWDSD